MSSSSPPPAFVDGARPKEGSGPEPWVIIVGVLLAWRIVMAAVLPLSADEAYYLLWSHHLQAGYFDHPPAIAFLIRAGTLLFSDTPLGVRAMGLPLSLLATWLVWRTAAMLLKDSSPARVAHGGGGAVAGPGASEGGGGNENSSPARVAHGGGGAVAGPGASEGGGGNENSSPARVAHGEGGDGNKAALAAVLFNLALIVNVELLAATPDMPSIVTVAGFLWALAKVQTRGDGAWWLVAGALAGLSLLSKYSMLFVGLGTALWLLVDARGRHWLKTPWPWLGGVLALAVFAPNLAWQARHDWMTFAFQFGRIGHGTLTLRYLAEFAGAQLGLVTPLILALAVMGFWQARRPGDDRFPLFVIVATALVYFLEHALRDRVQGNWPCFLMPALALFAADGFARAPRWLALAAAPLAAVMLLALYLQAALGLIPLKRDPVARLLARDFPAAAQSVAATVPDGVLLTTDYETTALLRYYLPRVPVIQVNEPWRYDWAPPPSPALLHKPLVYFTGTRRARPDLVAAHFGLMSAPLAHGPDYEGFLADDAKDVFGRVP